MREILFRGKRKLGNEWIEGSLHTEKFTDDEEYLCCEINQCDVYPETVGQYTGLTDKNGKKIFEGDIINGYRPIFTNKEKIYNNQVVRWSEVLACYCAGEQSLYGGAAADVYDVVGNVYDNPELLKEGAEQ